MNYAPFGIASNHGNSVTINNYEMCVFKIPRLYNIFLYGGSLDEKISIKRLTKYCTSEFGETIGSYGHSDLINKDGFTMALDEPVSVFQILDWLRRDEFKGLISDAIRETGFDFSWWQSTIFISLDIN